MKTKFFFGAFLTILTLLCVSIDSTPVANQELVVQISGSQSTPSQEAITFITNELKAIDVVDVKIEMLVNGALKVSYYSDQEASFIKDQITRALAINSSESLDILDTSTRKFPYDHSLENYFVDVYKTQDTNDYEGTQTDLIEPKLETTRSTHLENDAHINKSLLSYKNKSDLIAYNVNAKNNVAIDYDFHNIPEGRAGPLHS